MLRSSRNRSDREPDCEAPVTHVAGVLVAVGLSGFASAENVTHVPGQPL